jgi:hypothetical protein
VVGLIALGGMMTVDTAPLSLSRTNTHFLSLSVSLSLLLSLSREGASYAGGSILDASSGCGFGHLMVGGSVGRSDWVVPARSGLVT